MASPEDQHIELFSKLDFEAKNGADWDLFRHLHTEDVIVWGSRSRSPPLSRGFTPLARTR
jgi:hypothetical protein